MVVREHDPDPHVAKDTTWEGSIPGAGRSEGSAPLVLVVDDDERNLRLACDVLGAAGFRLVGATTGGEALAVAAERLPDVVLMDLRLPDMDGTEAARRLAADARTASIPVVLLSAARLQGEVWLRSTGFAGFLEKPIDVEAFPEQVRHYCGWQPPA